MGNEPNRVATCGTKTGYNHHYRQGENPCDACREAHNAQRRASRAAHRAGVPSRSLVPCGQYGAYLRHKRNNEDLCDACQEAARTYWRTKARRVVDAPFDT